MTLSDVLGIVAGILNGAEVPYMLTGSLAAAFHGAPRSTQDIDLIVSASVPELLKVAEELRSKGMYVSDDAIREAHALRGMFNAIHPESGWKIDFIMRKDRPFSQIEFESRSAIEFLGVELSIASAEDLVIAKLEWARLGNSERQLRDVAEIVAIQGDKLDADRIEEWAAQLGLQTEWALARELADS
jgi:nucleotidyltransferase AbiEii toxin of type IV toxin-antitoxin system